jgi:hypothetical protein
MNADGGDLTHDGLAGDEFDLDVSVEQLRCASPPDNDRLAGDAFDLDVSLEQLRYASPPDHSFGQSDAGDWGINQEIIPTEPDLILDSTAAADILPIPSDMSGSGLGVHERRVPSNPKLVKKDLIRGTAPPPVFVPPIDHHTVPDEDDYYTLGEIDPVEEPFNEIRKAGVKEIRSIRADIEKLSHLLGEQKMRLVGLRSIELMLATATSSIEHLRETGGDPGVEEVPGSARLLQVTDKIDDKIAEISRLKADLWAKQRQEALLRMSSMIQNVGYPDNIHSSFLTAPGTSVFQLLHTKRTTFLPNSIAADADIPAADGEQ